MTTASSSGAGSSDVDQRPAGAVGQLAEEQRSAAHRGGLEIGPAQRGEQRPVQRGRRHVGLRVGQQQVGHVGRGHRQPAVGAGQRPAPGPGRPRRPRSARRAAPGCSRAAGPAGSATPARWPAAAPRPAAPPPRARPRPRARGASGPVGRRRPPVCTPCQPGRNRPSARCSTGSTSARSRASEARRNRRSTSASQYSMPSGPALRPVPQRAQLAAHQPPGPDQPVQHADHHRHPEPEPGRALGRRERAVRAGVAQHQVAQRIGHRLGERLRHPDRQRGPERVAHPPGVLDRQPALLPADPHPDRPPRRLQLVEPLRRAPRGPRPRRWSGRRGSAAGRPRPRRRGRAGPAPAAAATPRPRPAPRGRAARGSPPSRAARPAAWSPATAPRPAARPAARRTRRGTSRRSRTAGCARTATAPAWPAPPPAPSGAADVGHQLAQPGQVVDVLHALAHRLERDRELLVAPGHREQLGGALALLPQRAAPLRVAARQQQRPCRALPEPGRVQRRRRPARRPRSAPPRPGRAARPPRWAPPRTRSRRPRPAAAARCRRRRRRRAPRPRAARASGPRSPAPTAR